MSRPRFRRSLALAAVLLSVAAVVVLVQRGDGPRALERAPLPESAQEDDPLDLERPEERPAVATAGLEGVQSEPARAAATPGSPAEEAPAGPFRGMVLDAATGDPLAYTLLEAGGLRVPVDGEGRFDAGEPLPPEVETIRVHNPVQRTHIRDVRREAMESDGSGGWVLRIAVGPAYFVRFSGVGDADALDWRVRLVELPAEGEPSFGSWQRVKSEDVSGGSIWLSGSPQDLQPSAVEPLAVAPSLSVEVPVFVRYDNPWEPNAPDSIFRLEAQSEDGLLRGASGPLHSAVGVYPGVVEIVVDRELASVRGRVVDEALRPKDHVRVTAFPLGASPGIVDGEWPETGTNGDGEFALRGLAPGAYRLVARPRRGERPQSVDVELPPGETRLADIVVAAQQGAGMIEGRLVSRRGVELERQIVRLRAVDGRDFELMDVSSEARSQYGYLRGYQPRPSSAQDGEDLRGHVFEFNEVPAGEYELSVVSLDGYAWGPASVRVSPPNNEVVLTREDDVVTERRRFRVLDAGTDAELERYRVQLQAGQAWNPRAESVDADGAGFDLPAGAGFDWTVSAEGFRPVSGTQRDFDERGVATVRLEPGWGARLVFRDFRLGFQSDDVDGVVASAERPPVAGVAMWADGQRVAGTSGPDGVLELALQARPERLEVRAAGWRVVDGEHFRDGRLLGDAPAVVVWLARAP